MAGTSKEAMQRFIDLIRVFLDDRKAVKYKKASSDEERARLDLIFEHNTWIADAARRAGQISMLTHVPKFTHGDSKSSGAYIQPQLNDNMPGYLVTCALNSPAIDVAGNAAALDVGAFLALADDSGSILEQVVTGECPALRSFAADEEQYQLLIQGFKRAVESKSTASSGLAKQLFFPVEDGYHLLSPLHSSSIMSRVDQRVREAKYSESQKLARAAKKAGKHSEIDVVSIPNLAVQSFGGSKPQNISQLNSKRGGKAYLLSSLPPKWQSRAVPLLNTKKSFWKALDRSTWYLVKDLKMFLQANKNRPSVVSVRSYREKCIDNIIDEFVLLASRVQSADDRDGGWSRATELPKEEQLWLDPKRSLIDSKFADERAQNSWRLTISDSFALWLNKRLSLNSTLELADPEYKEWEKLVSQKLKLVERVLEI